jgi:7-cyano-7-deazaguanine reductase
MTDHEQSKDVIGLADQYKALDGTLTLRAAPPEALRADLLLTFPYEHVGQDAEVEIHTKEFTALCPWTGLPDFGTLTVRYVPKERCIELKSLKFYLVSYRSVGIVQESAAVRILQDLVRVCEPKSMTVTLDYEVRDGLHTIVTVRHP